MSNSTNIEYPVTIEQYISRAEKRRLPKHERKATICTPAVYKSIHSKMFPNAGYKELEKKFKKLETGNIKLLFDKIKGSLSEEGINKKSAERFNKIINLLTMELNNRGIN